VCVCVCKCEYVSMCSVSVLRVLSSCAGVCVCLNVCVCLCVSECFVATHTHRRTLKRTHGYEIHGYKNTFTYRECGYVTLEHTIAHEQMATKHSNTQRHINTWSNTQIHINTWLQNTCQQYPLTHTECGSISLYGVATSSRLLKIIGLCCRISSLF